MIPLLLDITINEIDTLMGNTFLPIIGANLAFAGALILIIFIYFAAKMNLGIEAILVVGAFLLFGLTTSFAGSGGGTGYLPISIMAGVAIMFGFLLWKGFKVDL